MNYDCTDAILSLIDELDVGILDEGGTDKTTIHSYETVYGKYLSRYTNRKGNLLEIGVRFGGSSILWQELLPKFNLCLVDVEYNLRERNADRFDKSRTIYHSKDAYTEEFRDAVAAKYKTFDFICDDGPHTLESQLRSIELFLPLLSKDGVMVIEDIDPNNLETIKRYLDTNLTKAHAYEVFDLRHIKGRYDDIAIVIGNPSVIKRKSRTVMITMFKNEATVIRRMLESCAPYIDYWVIQNNGSTDGTDQIVKDFFNETGIPGTLYDVEEGWVGFGWNRDHLVKKCQSIDHGCDWILKMDCDELLEVDDTFPWVALDDKQIQAFNIPAVSGTCIYYRTWMWNANLPWAFNHDPCHETIYCQDERIGLNIQARDLPPSIRQVGYNEGQSWSVPTKFITDSLVLEEKMIREGNMLDNMYHFWYIAKSYNDAYPSSAFPLGESQQREYARRTIYYFQEYLNKVQKDRGWRTQIDEMNYMSLFFIGQAYEFLKEDDNALVSYRLAEPFAPERNDHLFSMALVLQRNQRWEEMLEVTTKMMDPSRTNPFPRYSTFIDTSIYIDSEHKRVQHLHEVAMKNKPEDTNNTFRLNSSPSKRLFIVDDFYADPDAVRAFALAADYKEDLNWYKGKRSVQKFLPQGIKQAFEHIIGQKINIFDEHAMNGCFQITTSNDRQVYHYDEQRWAAMIYLTPNAPIQSGTRTHRSRINGTRDSREYGVDDAFQGKFYDATRFDTADQAANIYNRLVIMDAKCIHSAGDYFGDSDETGRLIHLFFFD